MFQTVEMRITQGENLSRSSSWSSQSLVNLYEDVQDSGRTASALMPWPGEKPFSSGYNGTRTRGFKVVNGTPYVLTDISLYKVNANGSQSLVGYVPGTGFVSMADDGYNLIIRAEGTVTFINQKFIFAGNGATFVLTDGRISNIAIPSMLNAGEFVSTQVDSTDRFNAIGEARLSGDTLMQVYAHQKKIIMAGTDSIEVFYDSGDTPQPINTIQQAATSQIGVASSYSMAETPDFLYMLGADDIVYRMVNFDLVPVSTSAISKELNYSDTTDAQGFTTQLDGQWFYILQLPYSNLTLFFSEKTGKWGRLSSGTTSPIQRHIVAGVGNAYGKKLIAITDQSRVYEWDFDTFTSNDEPIARQFQTAPVNGGMVGAPGKRLVFNRVRFIMQTGVGNTANANPQLIAQYSIDGGKSFSQEFWLDLEREGQSQTMVNWFLDISAYDIMFRVRVTDSVFTSFHSATIDLKPAGF